jgi:hypothetical protein
LINTRPASAPETLAKALAPADVEYANKLAAAVEAGDDQRYDWES